MAERDQNFLCKTCGARLDELAAASENGLVKCPYCHNVWTVPRRGTDPAALSFLRMGEHDLDICKFDDAFAAYQKAAELDKEEPEAYFGMALAAFKVQYLKDEVNNRLQPICHEVTEKKFTEDVNYLRAFRYATNEQRAEYEKKGEEIDYILGEFFKLKQAGLDYDCFLCVKVTDGDGKTEDSKDADYIYELLRNKGYKPFYSERELRNVTGADYEARILYALSTSECMLVICREESYLQTKWVKNEYTRFLKLVNDAEKESDSVTVVFYKKPVERLPGRKGKLQGIDFSLREADGKIVNFVEMHTPAAKKRREAEKERKRREEEAQKRQIEEMRQQLAENERRAKEEAERRAKEEAERRAQEEEARNREREEMRAMIDELKRGNTPQQSAAPAGNLSPEQLLAMMRKAEEEEKRRKEEEERKRREEERKIREEEERKRREEEARLAAEKKAREEAEQKKREEEARLEAERHARETEMRNALLAQFEIQGNEIKKYKGEGGDVIIPYGVTSIGKRAFQKCTKLKTITIPVGVTSIGDCAFDGCNGLTGITVAEGNRVYRSEGNCIIERATNKLILGCKNSKIPFGVTSIGYSAFHGCSGLKSITIPDSVTSIGDSAFGGCIGLTGITIPGSVTSIGRSAFGACTKLKSIVIPDSVTSIGEIALYLCSGLESVTIPKRFKGAMNAGLKGLFYTKDFRSTDKKFLDIKSIQFTFT